MAYQLRVKIDVFLKYSVISSKKVRHKGHSEPLCSTSVANIPQRFAPRSIEGTYGCSTDVGVQIYSMCVVQTQAYVFTVRVKYGYGRIHLLLRVY